MVEALHENCMDKKSQGALIVGAQVEVTNIATGVQNQTKTNSRGYFQVPDLAIGNYSVTVSHSGFKTITTEARKLEINQSLNFAIKMMVGSTSQTVTVSAQSVTGVETIITPQDHLSITVGGNHSHQLIPYGDGQATVPGYNDRSTYKQYFATVDYTRTISADLLNIARVTAQRNYTLQDVPAKTLPGPTQLGVAIVPDLSSGPPTINFDNGLAIGFSQNGPTTFPDTTYGYTDTLSWYRGNHNFKFGAGFSAYQDNLRYSYASNGGFSFGSSEPASIGNQFADFLIGNPYAFVQGPSAPNNIRTKATYLFAQDSWRITSRLVLTYGLRYEFNTPKLDTKGRTSDILQGVQSTRFPAAPMGLVFPGDP